MTIPQTGGVQGKVIDGKDPLPAVSVSLLNFPSGTISDNDGNYLIDGILVGKYCQHPPNWPSMCGLTHVNVSLLVQIVV